MLKQVRKEYNRYCQVNYKNVLIKNFKKDCRKRKVALQRKWNLPSKLGLIMLAKPLTDMYIIKVYYTTNYECFKINVKTS